MNVFYKSNSTIQQEDEITTEYNEKENTLIIGWKTKFACGYVILIILTIFG